jgi:hypothetical protein
MMREYMSNNGYWYPIDVIPYIIGDLKKRFPNSIIRQQSDKVDIVVLTNSDHIPCEIQKTLGRSSGGTRIAYFQDSCRRQIDENINISGLCYLYIDSKFLEYLDGLSNTSVSLDMKWLYQYYLDRKVKTFSINHAGIIKELKDSEYNILTKFKITDLDRNKHAIEYNVLKWKGFTTDEINKTYFDFIRGNNNNRLESYLNRNNATNREREYGKICIALGQLNGVNKILNCYDADVNHCVAFCRDLGLFNKDGGNGQGTYATTYLTDHANIVQYFDGYENNKELWEYLRIHHIATKTFFKVIKGEYPNFLKDRQGQTNIEDAWNIN